MPCFKRNREVAEWSKAHAWKVCIHQKCIEGSNPFLSANRFLGGIGAEPPIFMGLNEVYECTSAAKF